MIPYEKYTTLDLGVRGLKVLPPHGAWVTEANITFVTSDKNDVIPGKNTTRKFAVPAWFVHTSPHYYL